MVHRSTYGKKIGGPNGTHLELIYLRADEF